MQINFLKAYTDNYIWLLETNKEISVIDPGEATPVLNYLSHSKKVLKDILITHHHFDHTGGIEDLRRYVNGKIYGPKNDIASITDRVIDGDCFSTLDIKMQTIAVPGHTLDHVAFYCQEMDSLFCGDTLFAGGCGRVFEGTHEDMFQSIQKLKDLPPETKVYCAHEYTESNLEFALEVDASNHDLKKRVADLSKKMTANNGCSIPSDLALELKTNPFLRCDLLRDSLKDCKTEMDAFSYLRSWKDNF